MKAKVILILSLFLLSCLSLNAQTISEDDVPQDVFISFKYKYPDATISGWETSGGNFIAKFKLPEESGKAEFTANGKWIASRFEIAEKELPSAIVNYYKSNYQQKGYVISISQLVKDASNNTYYYLSCKKSGYAQAKPVELFFDLYGALTKKIDPEENGGAAQNITQQSTVKDPGKDNNQTVKPADTTGKTSNFTMKELPTPVNSYIKANYPNHAIKESKFFKDPSMGDVYFLILKEAGFKEEVQLYFDIDGNLVKKVDAREARANQVQQKDPSITSSVKPTTTGPTPEEIKKKNEGDPIADTKVPAVAKTHFASKFKKATELSWYKKGDEFIARFSNAGRKGESRYSDAGAWKETRLDVDPLTLSPVIQTYLKDNFRKYKATMAFFVTSAPKNKYYEVHIVEKSNKSAEPPVTKVFFDANGKYYSIERPDVAADDPDAKQREADEQEFLNHVDATNPNMETGTGVNDAVNPKELPYIATDYIKKNYPEAKIKTCRYLFDDDLNAQVYYVTVKKEGDKYESELYFDLTGKLIKKLDPVEQKYGTENNQEKEKIDQMTNSGSEKVDPKELPSGIKTFISKNYPDDKVEECYYSTDPEFGNVYYLLLKKAGSKATTSLWFDLNGKLVKSEQSN